MLQHKQQRQPAQMAHRGELHWGKQPTPTHMPCVLYLFHAGEPATLASVLIESALICAAHCRTKGCVAQDTQRKRPADLQSFGVGATF